MGKNMSGNKLHSFYLLHQTIRAPKHFVDIFCESKDEAEVESRPLGPDPRLKLWIGGLEPTLAQPVGHN